MSKKVENMQKKPSIDVNQLIDENRALRRELEVQQRTVEALSRGALSGVVQTFQEQLRQVIAQRQHLEEVIAYFYAHAKHRYEDELAYVNELFQHARDAATDHNVPYLVDRLLNATREMTQAAVEAAETIKTKQFPDQVTHNFYWFMEHIRLESLWHFAGAITVIAWGEANDTRMIAHEVMRECEQHGTPHLKTVERLTMDWIEANLPEPPAKYETLRQGLQDAQEIRNGKKSTLSDKQQRKARVAEWDFKPYCGSIKLYRFCAENSRENTVQFIYKKKHSKQSTALTPVQLV